MRVALMRVAAIAPAKRFLRRIGAPVERLLEQVRLPPDLFMRPEALIPAFSGSRFLAAAARAEGIETFGSLVGEETRLEDLGTFGRQLLRGPTVYDAVVTAQRLAPSYHSGISYWLREGRVERQFCHRFMLQLDDWAEQTDQYALLTTVAFFRSVGGPAWQPTVHLKRGIPRAVRKTSLLRDAALVFDQPVSAVVVPQRFLHLPLVVPERFAGPSVDDAAAWSLSSPGADLVTRMRQWMMEIVRTDALRIEIVAETLGTTARTLQRRLAENGTTFAGVLAEARFEVATRLLARPDLAIRDVAREVGYPDAAHLTRAFRRWSGTTPSQFRRFGRALDGGLPRRVEPSRSGGNWQAPA